MSGQKLASKTNRQITDTASDICENRVKQHAESDHFLGPNNEALKKLDHGFINLFNAWASLYMTANLTSKIALISSPKDIPDALKVFKALDGCKNYRYIEPM